MDRREFFKYTGIAAAGLMLSDIVIGAVQSDKRRKDAGKSSGYFTLLQLASATDNIGNSYVLQTRKGSVIVMDGGLKTDSRKLMKVLKEKGSRVTAWFLSHPHGDHIGALNEILKNREELQIDTIYHSRFPEDLIKREGGGALVHEFYERLAAHKDTVVEDIQETGRIIDIDGVKFMILGVTNPEITVNPYNNSSMIIRVWDAAKSVVFLGDAGKECGDKVLAAYPELLDCDYLQMAHHGQSGCDEHFYKSVSFRACLWPTPSWVWDPSLRPDLTFLTTVDTRRWMDEKGITEHYVSCLVGDCLIY